MKQCPCERTIADDDVCVREIGILPLTEVQKLRAETSWNRLKKLPFEPCRSCSRQFQLDQNDELGELLQGPMRHRMELSYAFIAEVNSNISSARFVRLTEIMVVYEIGFVHEIEFLARNDGLISRHSQCIRSRSGVRLLIIMFEGHFQRVQVGGEPTTFLRAALF
jgi:hypothetical protein